MESIITFFLSFINDKTKKTAHKISWTAFALIALFLVNDFTGFSYYFRNKAKLWQIQQINDVLKDTTLSNSLRKDLVNLRQETFYHSPLSITLLKNVSKIPNVLKVGSISEVIMGNKNDIISRNIYIQILTSSWLLIIVMLLIPFQMKFVPSEKYGKFKKILIIFAIELILSITVLIVALLFSLLPIISNSPYWNYLVNFIISFSIILVMGIWVKKKEAKSAKIQK